jgi:hypothetical protein
MKTLQNSQVYYNWNRDSKNRILSGTWRREVQGVEIERDVVRFGDRTAVDHQIIDGKDFVVDARVIRLPGAEPLLLSYPD